MDFTVQLPTDPTERRRLQNRLAQRKFRQKKQRASIARSNASLASDSNIMDHLASSSAPILALTSRTEVESSLQNSTAPDGLNIDLEALEHFLSTSSDLFPLGLESTQNAFGSSSAPAYNLNVEHSHGLTSAPEPQSIPVPQPPKDPDPTRTNDAIVGLLTSARKDKGCISTLHIAAQKGHERIISLLLDQGNMDPNKQDSDGRTALVHAVIEDQEAVVRVLLARGASVDILDRDGRSAIHRAVLHQRLEILRLLLDHLVSDDRVSHINKRDNYDWAPLHMAVHLGFEQGALLLIQAGADVDAMAGKCPYTGRVVPGIDPESDTL